jgi:RNA polymerase sigma factor (sigma-70 family)
MDTTGKAAGHALYHHLEQLFENGTVSGVSEEQLLDRFTTHRDGSAFEALVERLGPMVLGVCRQFLRDPNDVDDAFQATFLVLVQKAGSLQRRELLGNWLYGVACRVCLRSRSQAIRRQTIVALFEPSALSPAAGISNCAESTTEAVLRDEERPLVHEEVNRLPRNYRTPIVLCYFEGLSHDQAAARLGWPVGTVKGRLSRARDILRTRLLRRGVAVSSAALASYLACAEVRASVPASLSTSTLDAALAVVGQGGAAITASSAVSFPVASLTEGVMRTMILSQVTLIVIPVLITAGILSAGASVIAFQPGGVASKPRQNRPNASAAKTYTQSTVAPPAESLPDTSELQLARQIVGDIEKMAVEGEGPLTDPESFNTWSLRLVEAENREAPSNATPVAAYEGHVQRMTRMVRTAEDHAKAGRLGSHDLARWKYFVKDAERMRDETSRASRSAMVGMMSRAMMAGASGMGMMRGAPRVVGQTAEQPPAGARVAQVEEPAMPQDVAGGGFGGDSGPDDDARLRINIARMSAAISTHDNNAKNIAVIKKLEEPISLHFPVETPLEDFLKQLKDATKGADGKRLSIYVDPRALQEAEISLQSPMIIDLDDVPLRLSLRLALKQLGLAYCVRDGVVMISTVEGIKQELMEARAEQVGPNSPSPFQH